MNINLEFIRGILFVRLDGSITNNNLIDIETNVFDIISKNGIKHVVMNFSGVTLIDDYGIKYLESKKHLVVNDDKYIVCGINNRIVFKAIKKSSIYKHLLAFENEVFAIKYLRREEFSYA